MRCRKNKIQDFLLALPPILWLLVFYALPVLAVFLLSFKPVDSTGGIGSGWTLKTLQELGNPNYPLIIWRTLWQGVVATAVCVIIAIPVSYYLARISEKSRRIFLMLIIIPFWTNFLIRIQAWKVFLHSEGVFKKLLVLIGLVPEETLLLYNQWAVLAVMIYTYLPFAILPIYASSEKFDFSLMDAALDLGASHWQSFYKVFLPGISKGISAAVMVVLIPAFGAYLIPDLVGGPGSELLGDKIAQRVFTERNLPHASALSAILMLVVFLPLLLWFCWKRFLSKNGENQKFSETFTLGQERQNL